MHSTYFLTFYEIWKHQFKKIRTYIKWLNCYLDHPVKVIIESSCNREAKDKCGRKNIFHEETTWKCEDKRQRHRSRRRKRERERERERERDREEIKERVLLAPGWPASHCYFEVQVDYSEHLYPDPASSPWTDGRGKPLFFFSIDREKRGETRRPIGDRMNFLSR